VEDLPEVAGAMEVAEVVLVIDVRLVEVVEAMDWQWIGWWMD